MILFKNDWEELHPTAIADYQTKNQSFVRLAALYREMGIKNSDFILALHNPDLQGVNPHDPNLTDDQKVAIMIECKENFWYSLREIACDPKGSPEYPIYFEANRGVIAASWLFFNHITFFLIMIRQTGKSFWLYWLYTFLMNFMLTKSEISHLTKDERLRMRDLESLKSMEMALPEYLRRRGKMDAASTEVYRISSLGNTFKDYVPNKSAAMADQIGRGMTAPIVGVDEFAYVSNNFITVNVMLSTTLKARELAIRKNEPYGNIFATTSGKRDTAEGRYAFDLVIKSAVMSEHFYDCEDEEQLYKVVKNASGGDLRVNATYNHQQLGKTNEWLRQRIIDAMQDDATQIEADFLNRWPSGTLTSPFPKEIAEAIRASEIGELYLEIAGPDCYALRWFYAMNDYEHFVKQDDHVLGIDPSDAVGRDAIGCVMLAARTGETAMAATVPKTNLISFAIWLCDFLEKNTRVTLIMERRGSGATLLDYLLLYLPSKGINPFERIYNTAVQDYQENQNRYHDIQAYSGRLEELCVKYKQCFGFATSATGATSRRDLYGKTLSSATRLLNGLIRDRTLILQMLGLVVRNNRVDHQEGGHDDMVIAHLLAFWLLAHGKNLSHYGMSSREILKDNPIVITQQTAKTAYGNFITSRARDQIKTITDQLSTETDMYVIKRLENDLRRLSQDLPEEERATFSIDALMTQVKERLRENAWGNVNYGSFTPYNQSGFEGTVYLG